MRAIHILLLYSTEAYEGLLRIAKREHIETEYSACTSKRRIRREVVLPQGFEP